MAQHPSYLPLYRALVEYAQDLLGVLDLAGQVRYLSPAAEQVARARPTHLVDQPFVNLCHPRDRDRFDAWFGRLQRSGERESCELRLGRDPHWRRLQLTGVKVNEDENSEVIVISGHDVTLEVESARALKASEQRYHGAFDYSPIGKALLLADSEVAECNRALAEMLGCWVSELIGAPLFARFPEEAAQALEQDTVTLTSRQANACEREVQVRPPGQPPQWLLINMAPIWNEDRSLEHFIVQLQDTTDRHLAEQALRESNVELQRSNEELKRFAFMASHDLREPLRGIGGSIQLIARRYKDVLDEGGRELAQQAVGGVKRLQALLDELVAYTEQMRGGELQRQSVATARLVDDIIAEFADRLKACGGEISHADLPSVLGEPEPLRQVFWHLLDNALKFAAPKRPPRIRVSASWGKGVWQFCVEDNGIGIAEEHHEQVFEVFRRLSVDTAGTGMGLATVRKMIERHGGRIWVESAPDQGARFCFTLPPE